MLALHAKQQSDVRLPATRLPHPSPCGTAVPVWNPAKQEWVTP